MQPIMLEMRAFWWRYRVIGFVREIGTAFLTLLLFNTLFNTKIFQKWQIFQKRQIFQKNVLKILV